MSWLKTALVLVIVGIGVSVASAQVGSLTVQVVDSSGPLPGATVTISQETGYIKTTAVLTDARGIAEFPVLRPGRGYTIEVKFPGFGMRRVSDIRVEVSKTTPITVQLSEELQERVKVTARSDVVDLEDTKQSSKFSDDFIQDLPVPGRFYQNVLPLAPGVNDANGDGNPNVHGARERDFKAIVSGVSNVDPLTGGFASRVNPNSIEDMEVITAGAGVEFSRAQGGFARILQKQGSNEFQGNFDFLFRSSKLDGNGAADEDLTNEPDFKTLQPGFQVSGPVIKDKLWFVLSHELINQDDPTNVVSGIAVVTTTQTINSDRLTWQVSPRNKLSFQFQSDPITVDNFGVSNLTPPESAQRRTGGGETYSITWTAPFSPKVLIESQVAYQDLGSGIFPSTANVQNQCFTFLPGQELPPEVGFLADTQCFNAETGQTTGSSGTIFDDKRERLTVSTNATLFGGRFWGMSHTFKMGFISENERYFRHLEIRPATTVFLFDPTTSGDTDSDTNPEKQAIITATLAVPQQTNVHATGNTWGIYVEDSMKPTNNFTVTWGLRLDREEINANGLSPFDPQTERLAYQAAVAAGTPGSSALQQSFTAYEDLANFKSGLATILHISEDEITQRLSSVAQQSAFWAQRRRQENINLTNNNLAPFLSLAWDPWSNGKTKFAATARRYYDKLFLNIPLIENNPATARVVLNAEILEPQVVFDPETGAEITVPGGYFPTGLRESVGTAVNIDAVSRDLRTPYNDEFTFSVERELWAETSIKFTYVKRKFRDQLQDVDINKLPGDFGRCRIPRLGGSNAVLEPSPGMSDPNDPDHDDPVNGIIPWPTDPYTGIRYPDTDPGIGDGYGPNGYDDCAGEIFVPEGQDINEEDPFSRENRFEKADGVPDLYLQNPGWDSIYLVGNYNKADYEAYVLELVRRQYRSWEMQASYTWAKAVGDGEDFNQSLGDDASQLQDERGYQSYDQRHYVKFVATTITPWGFRLGGVATWQSGLPYSLLTRKLSFDQVPPAFQNFGTGNSAQTRTIYKTGLRNDQRNSSYYNFDLRLTKEMNLGRGMNAQISAEVFNLLNTGTYKVFNPLTSTGVQINGNNVAVRDFGRQFQISFKLAF